jgi:hypothetical protein
VGDIVFCQGILRLRHIIIIVKIIIIIIIITKLIISLFKIFTVPGKRKTIRILQRLPVQIGISSSRVTVYGATEALPRLR